MSRKIAVLLFIFVLLSSFPPSLAISESKTGDSSFDASFFGRSDLNKGSQNAPEANQVLQNQTISEGVYNYLHLTPTTEYNCYGYALSTLKNINPGYYSNQTIITSDNRLKSIHLIKEIVVDDLSILGFYSSYVSSTYVLKPGEKIIARRTGNIQGNDDYHFMVKSYGSSVWYHKPGVTAILQSKVGPAGNVWYPEYYKNGWNIAQGYYNSPIIYVVVRKVPIGIEPTRNETSPFN
jgi:hypothetical protein